MASQRSKKEKDPYVSFILEKLGARLKSFRKDRGYANYEKFANAKNLNRSQVGRYETEKICRSPAWSRYFRRWMFRWTNSSGKAFVRIELWMSAPTGF